MKEIQYFYSCHSAYAYLGAWRLAGIAAGSNARIIHRPFDFDPVMQAAGGKPFRERSKAHVNYFFGRELRRWSEFRNLPMIRHRPTYHDKPLAPGNGIIIAAQNTGQDTDALSQAILQAHWRDDADVSDPVLLASLADALGMDGAALMQAALTEEIQSEHVANTNTAIDAHVFGSPTYFVDDDMFYGQDRLELVAYALRSPFAL